MFLQDRDSSLEIGFVPKVQWDSSKNTPSLSSARKMILIAEAARCFLASPLSDQLHKVRFFTNFVTSISSGIATALRNDSVRLRRFRGDGRGSDKNRVPFREHRQLRYSKHLEKSTQDNYQSLANLIGHPQLRCEALPKTKRFPTMRVPSILSKTISNHHTLQPPCNFL